MSLTPQRKRFVDELIGHGGTQKDAAIRAGYAPEHAASQASAIMADPEVKAYVKESREALGDRMGITPERILQELAIIGFASPEDYLSEDEDGNKTIDVKKLRGLGARAFTLEFQSTSTGKETVRTTKAKMLDKADALLKMGKQIGMFTDKVEHNISMSLEQLVAESFKKDASGSQPPEGPQDVVQKDIIAESAPSDLVSLVEPSDKEGEAS